MNRKRFDSNLRLLKRSDAKTAFQLAYVDPSDLILCKTDQGEPNLRRMYQGVAYEYHDHVDPQKAAKEWFSQLSLARTAVLYVYGLGLGYAYAAAKEWLQDDSERMIIFLEDDLAVVARFLETALATAILKDPQVKICTSDDLVHDKDLFEELSWSFVSLPFAIEALPFYANVKEAAFLEVRHQLSYQSAVKASLVSEYLDYGIVFFRNFYPNLLELPKASLGDAIFSRFNLETAVQDDKVMEDFELESLMMGGDHSQKVKAPPIKSDYGSKDCVNLSSSTAVSRFKDVPAIICGAGPSLNKNIDLLRGLQEQALIFAGGSALNVFCKEGIEPHFGAGIDPNATQYDRIKENQQFATPFFYRNRFNHEALKAIRGPRFYLSGSGGYAVSDWIEQQLGIAGKDLDEGHNIVNFSVSIAHALGCNPIIFVGVDMAYTGMKSYADGVVEDPHLTKTKIILETAVQDDKVMEDFDSQAIERTDIFGKSIYTLWKWVAESEWISNYAREHADLMFINATEGGLGFEGIPNRPLKEVIKTCLERRYPLRKMIQSEAEKNRLSQLTKEDVMAVLVELQSSLVRSIGFIDSLLDEVKQLKSKIKSGGAVASLDSPAMILAEMELTDEPAYCHLLDNFNAVYLKISQRAIQRISSGKRRLSDKRKQLMTLEVHEKRLTFLKDTARFNVVLIEQLHSPYEGTQK
jgi:hypothetical protein